MPTILHLQVYRKPELTPQEFRHHYETEHLPLMKKLSGDLFPLSHVRRYVVQARNEQSGDYKAVQQLGGAANAFTFDAISEIAYRDMEHFQAHSALLQSTQNQRMVTEDCEKFMDTARTSMILLHDGDVVETRG